MISRVGAILLGLLLWSGAAGDDLRRSAGGPRRAEGSDPSRRGAAEIRLRVPGVAIREDAVSAVLVRLEDPTARSYPPTRIIGLGTGPNQRGERILWQRGLDNLLWGPDGSDLPLERVRRVRSFPFCVHERSPAIVGLLDLTGDKIPEVIVGGHSGYGHYGYFGVTYILDLHGQPIFKGKGTEVCLKRPGMLNLQPLPEGGLQALPPRGQQSSAPGVTYQWSVWGFLHPSSRRVTTTAIVQSPSSFHGQYVILRGTLRRSMADATGGESGPGELRIEDSGAAIGVSPWFPFPLYPLTEKDPLSVLGAFLDRPVEAAGRLWVDRDGTPWLDATSGRSVKHERRSSAVASDHAGDAGTAHPAGAGPADKRRYVSYALLVKSPKVHSQG